MLNSPLIQRLSLLICLGLGVNSASYAENKDIHLQTLPVVYQQIAKEVVVDGVIEAVNEATIAAQTSGQVQEVYFDVDDFVKKDMIIAKLKSIEQKASVAQGEAGLREAQANLRVAQDTYNRTKKIFEKQAISASEMEKASAELDAAKARVATAQAGNKRTSQQEEYTTIRAPYSGIVKERHIQPGEIANVGQAIMTGFSLDELRVIATISQSQAADIRHSQTATIIIHSLPNKPRLTVNKVTVVPYADAQSHTFRVRLPLAEAVDGMYPGMLVKVAFNIGTEQRLMIPISAVAYRGEIRAVYVVDEKGQVFMRQIRLGKESLNMIEVLAGLEIGEQIATNSVDAAIKLKSQRAVSATTPAHP
ncbi:efflux RND transporter periplasmic adaptor subunit [Beggiatoa leptomitoformis]|uniref:Efflux RND transporter periplasmic adaptor subunit n=1 Tax=Beggiatoa leptomitoformis TaxID=288004 RepID=A0A2N9YAX0_9GAMM|nr:efflux RND transporter periplasmic adaptor subunit [Beggiatoa leptomitoformis]ALG69318.2 efflux RND transporter periplasmic adaptor subunit [Beggiatoa leptomitoformis]AUI67608.1 efflux RND transporter periplasmic adaptor subunit [Beggiatoa leptomitoformis]